MVDTQKIWTMDAMMMYPKQWIVMTHVEHDCDTNKYMGFIHSVLPEKKEAYRICKSFKENGSAGKTRVVEGFNDTPQIGGFTIHELGGFLNEADRNTVSTE